MIPRCTVGKGITGAAQYVLSEGRDPETGKRRRVARCVVINSSTAEASRLAIASRSSFASSRREQTTPPLCARS